MTGYKQHGKQNVGRYVSNELTIRLRSNHRFQQQCRLIA
jgi:hypothetical protein